jgi:hypothetical protein
MIANDSHDIVHLCSNWHENRSWHNTCDKDINEFDSN